MKDDAQGVILVADPDENTADDLLPWSVPITQPGGNKVSFASRYNTPRGSQLNTDGHNLGIR